MLHSGLSNATVVMFFAVVEVIVCTAFVIAVLVVTFMFLTSSRFDALLRRNATNPIVTTARIRTDSNLERNIKP